MSITRLVAKEPTVIMLVKDDIEKSRNQRKSIKEKVLDYLNGDFVEKHSKHRQGDVV